MGRASCVEGVVVSKGRKYITVEDRDHYKRKVLMNELCPLADVGDAIHIYAEEQWEYNSYLGKEQLKFFRPILETKARDIEIERWTGYVKKGIKTGYLYTKGLNKLHELGAEEQLAELQNLWQMHLENESKQYHDKIISLLNEMLDENIYPEGLMPMLISIGEFDLAEEIEEKFQDLYLRKDVSIYVNYEESKKYRKGSQYTCQDLGFTIKLKGKYLVEDEELSIKGQVLQGYVLNLYKTLPKLLTSIILVI